MSNMFHYLVDWKSSAEKKKTPFVLTTITHEFETKQFLSQAALMVISGTAVPNYLGIKSFTTPEIYQGVALKTSTNPRKL